MRHVTRYYCRTLKRNQRPKRVLPATGLKKRASRNQGHLRADENNEKDEVSENVDSRKSPRAVMSGSSQFPDGRFERKKFNFHSKRYSSSFNCAPLGAAEKAAQLAQQADAGKRRATIVARAFRLSEQGGNGVLAGIRMRRRVQRSVLRDSHGFWGGVEARATASRVSKHCFNSIFH